MAFPIALKTSSAICATTGIIDLILGPNFLLKTCGAPPLPSGHPVVESQYRFFGGIWAGYGAMVWWASNDVKARRAPLALLGGIMILGGVGRLLAAWHHGFGEPLMAVFAGIEILGPVILGLLKQSTVYEVEKKSV